jgi:hypothetical protein
LRESSATRSRKTRIRVGRTARGGIHRAERRIDRIMQRELAAVSTETAPFRSLVVSIDSTSTKPSIYAGETKTARPAQTGDKERYTQADPIGGVRPYAYADGNPIGAFDPYGLFTVVDRIARVPTLNLDSVCPPMTGGACTENATVSVLCDCNCDGTAYVGTLTLYLTGRLYYYNAPFHSMQPRRRTANSTVINSATAIQHEYNYHINLAVESIRPTLEAI